MADASSRPRTEPTNFRNHAMSPMSAVPMTMAIPEIFGHVFSAQKLASSTMLASTSMFDSYEAVGARGSSLPGTT